MVGKLKALFLDSGGVITRLLTPKPAIFFEACRAKGMDVLREAIDRAFEACDALLSTKEALFLDDYGRFHEEYLRIFRKETGLGGRFEGVDEEYMRLLQSRRHRALYEDVLPALQAMDGRDLRLGVITNASRGIISLLLHLGVAPYFEVIVASGLVGCEKPQREIFEVALEALDVAPEEAVHVGDSYYYDYLGATRAGLQGVLLDRNGSAGWRVPKVRSLLDLPAVLHL